MAGGYAKVGNDLDNLLELWQTGDGYAAATGYAINGADLNTRYAPASVGTGYTGGTGYDDNDVDIGPRFCAKGARNSKLPIDGQLFIAHSQGIVSGAMDASITIAINADGTYTVTKLAQGASSTAASGVWLPSGQSASDYQVQFVWQLTSDYQDGPATVTNGAATYQACTSNHTIDVDAFTDQHSGQRIGSQGDITINLKRISTGAVGVTTCHLDVESIGTA